MTTLEINRKKEEISHNLYNILKDFDMRDESLNEEIYELIYKFFRIDLTPLEKEKVVNYIFKIMY